MSLQESHNQQTDDGQECRCVCEKSCWANVMCGLGIGAGGFLTTTAIVNLIDLPDVPSFALCIFMAVFGLYVIVAELRRFKAIRGLIYNVVQFAYFITYYTGRGLFMFFCGTCIFDWESVLNVICCIYCCTVGVLLIFINLYWKLPTYIDPQVAKKEAEERIRREVEEKYANAYEQKVAAEQAAAQGAAQAQHAAVNMQNNAANAANAGAMHAQQGAFAAQQNANAVKNQYAPPPQGGGDDPFRTGGQGGEPAPYSPPHLN